MGVLGSLANEAYYGCGVVTKLGITRKYPIPADSPRPPDSTRPSRHYKLISNCSQTRQIVLTNFH